MEGQFASCAPLLDVGWNADGGDAEADTLPLAAAEAAHGVAELDEFEEVWRLQAGTAKELSGAELALDDDSACVAGRGGQSVVVGGVGTLGGAGETI